MATIVLRVRLTGGDQMDVTYDQPDTVDPAEITEHVIANATLAQNSGVLRSRHVTGSWCGTAGVLPP